MGKFNFDKVENYFHRLVVEHLMAEYADSELAKIPGALEDIACLALNQLPPRYVRHSVDAAFYLAGEPLETMKEKVRDAVKYSAKYVAKHPRTKPPRTPSE